MPKSIFEQPNYDMEDKTLKGSNGFAISPSLSKSGNAMLYINGATVASGSGFTAAAESNINLGRISGSTTFLNGTVNELLIYNSVLSAPQRQEVENYLGVKWGILPNTLSLRLWLDGADPAGTGVRPANGDAVTTWFDKSGNGNSASGCNSPTYNATTNSIIFNGTNQYFTSPHTSSAKGESIFVVFTLTSNVNSALVNTNIFGGRSLYSTPSGLNFHAADAVALLNGTIAITSNVRYIGEVTYNPAGINIYLSGVPSGSNTTNPNLSANGITWIGRGASANQQLNGTISEVLVYNSVLSTDQRLTVESYLSKKWNITVPTNYYTGILSNATPVPTPTLTTPTITQANMNLGYLPVPVVGQGNPGTSTLHYDGTNWSLN